MDIYSNTNKSNETLLDYDIFPAEVSIKNADDAAKYIFKKGSRTFYNSSRFFSKELRKKITIIYAFVRIADNYVDDNSDINFRRERLSALISLFYLIYETEYLPNSKVGKFIIQPFVQLVKESKIEINDIQAFFDSMIMDLNGRRYKTIDETLEYIYGSAEVIGLMIAKILNLKDDAIQHAKELGRAMQFINFIRDIAEDEILGRSYFPQEEIRKFGLEAITFEEFQRNPQGFVNFMEFQLSRYRDWRKEAGKGFKYLPKVANIAIKTASNMYDYTADKITENPEIIFKGKVKPSKPKILIQGILNLINVIITEQ